MPSNTKTRPATPAALPEAGAPCLVCARTDCDGSHPEVADYSNGLEAGRSILAKLEAEERRERAGFEEHVATVLEFPR